MNFTLSRKHTLSGFGHVIKFVKDEPVYVPPLLRNAAIELGAEPDEAMEASATSAEAGKSAAQLESELFDVFNALVLKNDPKDFTAGGTPKVAAVVKALGYDVDAAAVATGYAKFKQAAE